MNPELDLLDKTAADPLFHRHVIDINFLANHNVIYVFMFICLYDKHICFGKIVYFVEPG